MRRDAVTFPSPKRRRVGAVSRPTLRLYPNAVEQSYASANFPLRSMSKREEAGENPHGNNCASSPCSRRRPRTRCVLRRIAPHRLCRDAVAAKVAGAQTDSRKTSAVRWPCARHRRAEIAGPWPTWRRALFAAALASFAPGRGGWKMSWYACRTSNQKAVSCAIRLRHRRVA